jgi:hypothetical protein
VENITHNNVNDDEMMIIMRKEVQLVATGLRKCFIIVFCAGSLF